MADGDGRYALTLAETLFNIGSERPMTTVELGAVLVDPVDFAIPPELLGAELEVLTTELGPALAAYLAKRPGVAVKTLADVIAG